MSKSNGLINRNGVWHMRFVLRGVAVAETTSTSNRREAELMVARRKTEILNQTMLGKLKTIKLHDAIDQFVASRAHLPSNGSRKFNLALFKTLPNIQLDKVTRSDTQSVIDDRFADKTKASTVATTVTYFNAMVNHFERLDYLVCKKLDRITGFKGRIRWLTDDEEVALFKALDPNRDYVQGDSPTKRMQRLNNYELAIALRHTGARLNEIETMQWNQVDFKRNEVHIKRGKGSNDSTIVMSDVLRDMFIRRRSSETSDYVFPTKVKGAGTDKGGNAWITRAVKAADINTKNGSVSLHTLRHTAAVKWHQGGMSLLELKDMLGHKDIESTMVYAHLVPGNAAKKAADILNARTKPAVLKTAEPAATALRLVV